MIQGIFARSVVLGLFLALLLAVAGCKTPPAGEKPAEKAEKAEAAAEKQPTEAVRKVTPPPENPLDKMTLAEQLEYTKKKLDKETPAETVKVYERGIQEVRASGVAEKALKVGDKAPDFELFNTKREKVKLSELVKKGPVVIVWYRGNWCPYDQLTLKAWEKALPQVRWQASSMVAISPQTPNRSAVAAGENGLTFDVLSDPGDKVAREYGLAYKIPDDVVREMRKKFNLADYNGGGANELPLTATYAVGYDGSIIFAHVDADYRKRAEPADVIKVLGAQP